MDEIDRAVAETRSELALARGVCPIVARRWRYSRGWTGNTLAWDATEFCTHCPDARRIPAQCPEAMGREHSCALWKNAYSVTGSCVYAEAHDQHERCTCFTPKGEAWHAAYNAWTARREREDAQDARVRRERRRVAFDPLAEMVGDSGVRVIG